MKLAIIVPDGMADRPEEMDGGATPLERARTPEMDRLAREGVLGRVVTVPEDVPPGSDAAIMSILGADPREHAIGRAALEAAGRGIELADDEVVFRVNLITEQGGVVADYSSDTSDSEGEILIEALKRELDSDDAQLHKGVGYRHLLVMKGDVPGFEALRCNPPHDIQGKPVAENLPGGEGAASVRLRELTEKARTVLTSHELNDKRREEGRHVANALWPWGQGRRATLPGLLERFGLTGAVISAVDLVRGIGRLMGMDVIDVEGATGELDTNFAGKGEAAADALDVYGLVFVHVEAPDEASHRGDAEGKRRAIESADREVVSRVRRKAEERGDVRLLVLPDHLTPLAIRTHAHGGVPFALRGPGVAPSGADRMSERAAEASDTCIERGAELLAFALRETDPDWDG